MRDIKKCDKELLETAKEIVVKLADSTNPFCCGLTAFSAWCAAEEKILYMTTTRIAVGPNKTDTDMKQSVVYIPFIAVRKIGDNEYVVYDDTGVELMRGSREEIARRIGEYVDINWPLVANVLRSLRQRYADTITT